MPATRSPTGQYVRTRSPRLASASWRSSPRPLRTWISTSRSSPPIARLAARAWAIERRPRLEQAPRERLEVAIGIGLDLEDRRLPAVLARLDDLVVPVGALDQADEPGIAARGALRPVDHALAP